MTKKLIDGNGFTLFDDKEFENYSFNELIKKVNYQEKARNILIQIIQRFTSHIKETARTRILASYGDAEEYLSLLLKNTDYSQKKIDDLIDKYFGTQYADYVIEKQPDFLSLKSLLYYRIQKIISNDEELKLKIKQITQDKDGSLYPCTISDKEKKESLSTCPEKNEKEFSDAQADESQAPE